MKTIVVLGMQRSATSLVAKGLERSGDVYMEPFNAAHWDNYEVYRINNAIIEAAGGREFDPPIRPVIRSVAHRFEKKIKDYVQKKEQETEQASLPFWGIKISNMGWVIDHWHPHLTEPHYVWIQRDPDIVADHLVRDGFLNDYEDNTVEYATDLVDEYNSRVIQFLTERAKI